METRKTGQYIEVSIERYDMELLDKPEALELTIELLEVIDDLLAFCEDTDNCGRVAEIIQHLTSKGEIAWKQQ